MARIRLAASCEFSDLLWAGGNGRPCQAVRADPDSISSCFVLGSPAASAGTCTARSAGQAELPSEQDLDHKVPNAVALEGATGTYSFLQGTQGFNLIFDPSQQLSTMPCQPCKLCL